MNLIVLVIFRLLKNGFILFCTISAFLLSCSSDSNCKENSQDRSVLNKQITKSLWDIDTLLLPVIKEVMDSNDRIIRIRPELGYDEYFYCLRIFKQNDDIFITIFVHWSFPLSQYYNDAIFSYDTTNMYYFNLYDRNVIIMDSPENGDHKLFHKSKFRKFLAMRKKLETGLLLSKFPPIMSDRETYRITIKLVLNDTFYEIVPVDTVYYSPPYKSEKSSMCPVIDVYGPDLL